MLANLLLDAEFDFYPLAEGETIAGRIARLPDRQWHDYLLIVDDEVLSLFLPAVAIETSPALRDRLRAARIGDYVEITKLEMPGAFALRLERA